ncbi:TRAP-type C4-dicarboxylate transport system permease small subunit [Humitalea rosea]|uniref:TRAP transporter small permease protein n=1 Tax=Humitalea rosea TaxID=990373 RepID=A0A2W7IG20_9PROT|nr:TRAP transporter small permease [Humitalea rosea]PZW45683.1 TRAP-type C4-dicarboxylate transport system permease small subunit [Humitalea rosea]
MSDPAREDDDAPPGPPPGVIGQMSRLAAMAGGAMLIATALFTTISVLKRWLTNDSIPGDFELVQIGSGLSVFGFFAYGTLMKSNILVDSFTGWLPARLTDWMDAFWTLVWAGVMLVLAERISIGALEMRRNNTETMVLAMPLWWAVGLGALAFGMTGIVALWWVRRLLGGQDLGGQD